jgi:predicted transcriptional regulator
MAVRSTINFHLPLTPELHEQLREEAERSGQPATAVAREALQNALYLRRKRRRHAEIAAFASEHAGSAIDLDEDLERASLESLRGLDSK